jgi:hypothetical protein
MASPNRRNHLTNRTTPAPFRSRPGGMGDQAIARELARLDRRAGRPSSTAERIAAWVALETRLSDGEIADALGVPVEEVALVRARVLAGRPPEVTGGPGAAQANAGSVDTREPVQAVRRTQERSDEKVAGCATLALSLPTFAVVGPDGTEVGGFSYRGAMVHRARYGGELRVEGP